MQFDDPKQEAPVWTVTNNAVLDTPFPGIRPRRRSTNSSANLEKLFKPFPGELVLQFPSISDDRVRRPEQRMGIREFGVASGVDVTLAVGKRHHRLPQSLTARQLSIFRLPLEQVGYKILADCECTDQFVTRSARVPA